MAAGLARPENVVGFIQDENVRVEYVTPEVATKLRALGGVEVEVSEGPAWVLHAPDEGALAHLVGGLRDMGLLFSEDPHEWSPADVFADLREKGLVQGMFSSVIWLGPGKWRIRVQ